MILYGKNYCGGHEFDKIATGHYATTTEIKNKVYLSTAADKVKDQTYFLGQVDYLQISKLMFPIGHLQKSEVRAIAAEQGLPSALRKDSQGICFLGKINYNDFIRRYLGEKPGKIVEWETGKILGEHKGYWFHTIGQRRGLQLSGGPWFVVKKDIPRNIIYVSNGYDPDTQYGKTVNLQGFHVITGDPWGDFSGEKRKISLLCAMSIGNMLPEYLKIIRVQNDTKTGAKCTTKWAKTLTPSSWLLPTIRMPSSLLPVLRWANTRMYRNP
ncbi:hypothetical protein FACS189474_5480 [Bacteroidia bacterium]|nr:hypothetical protein FACS189474_5480 [Bacteroidia bacterium]